MARSPFSFILILFLVSCRQNEDKIHPVETTITESVYASVTVQPDSLYQAFAVVNGILDENIVEEGDTVKKGDLLVQITSTSPELASKNAFLALQLARDNYKGGAAILSSLEKEIEAAELQFLNDSVNFRRQQRLWEQQIGSQTDLENRRLAFKRSGSALEVLRNRYEQTENELETQLLQAENTYKATQVNTGDFSVRSKINGRVYAVHKNPGEIVNATQSLVTLGSVDKFVIEMLVDEEDIVRVRRDQPVLVSLDAYPGKIFKAHVHKIYPKKDERNQTFLVEALFETSPEVLLPGLSGEANIVVEQREKALVIPRQYLVGDSGVRTEAGIVKVVTGLESLDSVEIKEGINRETEIFPPRDE